MTSKTIPGARAIFRLNFNKIAYASSVSYNENITIEDVNVLDKVNPEELAETGYNIEFSCQSFVTDDNMIKSLGIMPRFQDILKAGILTAELIDRSNENVLFIITGVKCLGRSGQLDSRGLLTETWNFRGLKEES